MTATTAASWLVTSPIAGVQPIGTTSTTKNHDLGLEVYAHDTSTNQYGTARFVYMQGVASTIVGAVVTYDVAFQTALLVASTTNVPSPGRPLAIAMSINLATGYGWYMVQGQGDVVKGALVAAGVPLYTSSVAGAVQATTVTFLSGTCALIEGMWAATSVNSANSTVDMVAVIIDHPRLASFAQRQ